MSFVPVTGPATFRAGEPPRESVVEFSDDRRTVSLPMLAALPILTKAHARDDLHPSVGLLSGAALLGMRLVAAGKFEPAGSAPSWRVTALDAADEDRVVMLAQSRAHGGLDAAGAEGVIRQVLDAVADAMPRSAPQPVTKRPAGGYSHRLRGRLEEIERRTRPDDRPQLVTVSLRVEADEEELVAGAVRLVLQVHDARNPLHVCDAALLWTESGPQATHGFGDRARTHATLALRAAADAWPVLDRLLDLRVPDEITLDTDELVSLLDEGVGALKERGVDVLWPRSLGRDLTATTVLDRAAGPREAALVEGLFGPDALFSFNWQIALHGDPLTPEEMDLLAGSAAPVLKLRGSWTVIDPAIARKARRRLLRTVKPAQALAATLTGVVEVEDPSAGSGHRVEEQVVVGATLRRVREQLRTAATRPPIPAPAALEATLRDYQRHGLTWLADMTSLGLGACLADDMGLGKTVTLIALHLHRLEAGATGPTLVVCPASLLGNWEAEIERFAPGVAVRRFHGGRRSPGGPGRRVRADDLRHHAPATTPRSRTWPGTWSSPTRPSTSRTPAPRPRGRCGRSRARPGWR